LIYATLFNTDMIHMHYAHTQTHTLTHTRTDRQDKTDFDQL